MNRTITPRLGDLNTLQKPAEATFAPAFYLALLALCAGGTFWYWRQWDHDDGFIVYRYVQNLLGGQGWVFNVGEAVNSSTSVLNPVLTALFALIPGLSIPYAAHLVGIFSLVLGIGFLGVTLLQQRKVTLALGLLPIAFFLPILQTTKGLETQLFLGLVMLLVALEMRGRDLAAWVVVGLLFLARPDGALFGIFKLCSSFIQNRKIPVKGPLLALTVAAPWLIFSAIKFHAIAPASLANKMTQGRVGGLNHGMDFLALFPQIIRNLSAPHSLLLLVPLAFFGAVRCVMNRDWPLSLPGCFAVIQIGVYTAIGVPQYGWYYAVAVFAFFFYVALGLNEVVALARAPQVRTTLGITGVAGLACLAAFQWAPSINTQLDPREAAYREVSQVIRERFSSAKTIALEEVGTVGFLVGPPLRIVDLMGLTSDNPPYYLGHENDRFFSAPPELVVMRFQGEKAQTPQTVSWGEAAIYTDERFQSLYELVWRTNEPRFPQVALFVFKPGVSSF